MLLSFDKLLHSDKFEAYGFQFRKIGPNSAIRNYDLRMQIFSPEEIVRLL
jgi:hypothetical protein